MSVAEYVYQAREEDTHGLEEAGQVGCSICKRNGEDAGWLLASKNGAKAEALPSNGNHDVNSAPPTRTAGSHRRLCMRQSGGASELLPHLQIVDPVYPKTPFRQYQV